MPIDQAAITAIRPKMQQKLRQVEEAHGVEILFAIESGSRAWGFASPDSDFDCRFVYRHKRDWYMSIREERDVIEEGIDADDLDVAGWDLRKALRLMHRSNPVLHEWLTSPIVWLEQPGMRAAFIEVYGKVVDLTAFRYHHVHMAKIAADRHLRGEKVKLKRYFYVLRPLITLRWMEEHKAMPPMSFDTLLAETDLPADMRRAIDDLTILKASTPELGLGDHIAALDAWAEAELERAFANRPNRPLATEHTDKTLPVIDAFFRKMIGV